MPDTGVARPDLCPVRAAVEQAELAEAARGGLSADGHPQAGEVLEASAGNDAAVAAYRLSVQAGNPLSERRLAQMFGRTSRRWARARIADARQASPLPDSPSTPVTACVADSGVPAGMPY